VKALIGELQNVYGVPSHLVDALLGKQSDVARLRRDRNSAENGLRILETRLAELERALRSVTDAATTDAEHWARVAAARAVLTRR
jgi:hypothetical protein